MATTLCPAQEHLGNIATSKNTCKEAWVAPTEPLMQQLGRAPHVLPVTPSPVPLACSLTCHLWGCPQLIMHRKACPSSSEPTLVTVTVSAHDHWPFLGTPTFQSAGWSSAFVHPTTPGVRHPPHSPITHSGWLLRLGHREESNVVWKSSLPLHCRTPPTRLAGYRACLHVTVLNSGSVGAHSPVRCRTWRQRLYLTNLCPRSLVPETQSILNR